MQNKQKKSSYRGVNKKAKLDYLASKTHRPQSKNEVIKYTTLFANVGVGETYLKDIGFEGAVANELLEDRAEWYQDAYPECEMIQGDIMNKDVFNKVVQRHKDLDCKLLLSSPPCQDFSKVGGQKIGGKKTFLFQAVLDFAEETKVPYIMIENVKEFWETEIEQLGTSGGKHTKKELEAKGYIVNVCIVNAKHFDTPQSRTRTIILATYKATLDTYPEWTHPEYDKDNEAILGDYIGEKNGIPTLNRSREQAYDKSGNPIKWHVAPYIRKKHMEIMQNTPTGCSAHLNNISAFKPKKADGSHPEKPYIPAFTRNSWDKPAACILQGSDSPTGVRTFHPGNKLEGGTYSNPFCFSLLEIFIITGLGRDPFVPLWAYNNHKLIRQVMGECFAPQHVKAIVGNIPRT